MEVIGSVYVEASDRFQKGIIRGGHFPMCKSCKTRFRSNYGRCKRNRLS